MKKTALFLVCIGMMSVYATPCEEVIEMISNKIKANGVSAFTLEAIDKGSPTDGKIVGVCGEGTKDIVYKRGNAQTAANTTAE
ncbi:MAG: DUF1161 domain-containing protein [Campylobacteraceae bacterium]|jgi:hypothetical protein|nr:DUF1161 domain-containing protein [Campylobacteraceae bacterium]